MTGWTDKLSLQMLDLPSGDPDIRGGRAQWGLSAPLRVPFPVPAFTVPLGATTDFASIPRIFWTILPPDGPWLKAAVAHDYLYRTKGMGGKYTRAQADAVLRDGMKLLDVPAWKRYAIYAAVRAGGWSGWGS